MEYLYNNKKIALLLLALILLFPFGIYMFRAEHLFPQINTFVQPQPKTPQPSASPSIETMENEPKKRLIDYIQNRKPLSQSDTTIRANILAETGTTEQSGEIYSSPNIFIEYVRSADIFQVEIKSTEIDMAKTEALVWFQNKGMSKEGLCAMPISFYLNYDIKTQIGEAADSFDPLPPGC